MKNLFLIIAVVFSACTSLQKDLQINSTKDQTEKELVKFETIIVPLEALGGNEARKRQSDIQAARKLIDSTEKEASADADYSGKLIAWSGRLAILEGRYSEAQRLYRQSNTLSPGNTPAVILNIHLEGDPAKRLELIEKELALSGRQTNSSYSGELNIERGRALFEIQRFSEAAGAFDTAFGSDLNAVYRQSYQEQRDRAWELRNTRDASALMLEILGNEKISWKDCITIAKSETHLLLFLSGGRNLSDAEFFNQLLDRAFIPYIQDINISEWPVNKPKIDESVTRSGAAWFIWHLYAEARADRSLLLRYSNRYATGPNPRSPIPDVPPLSPFFDSILGCVETELISLPDGRNFLPARFMRGAELLTILKKIDS